MGEEEAPSFSRERRKSVPGEVAGFGARGRGMRVRLDRKVKWKKGREARGAERAKPMDRGWRLSRGGVFYRTVGKIERRRAGRRHRIDRQRTGGGDGGSGVKAGGDGMRWTAAERMAGAGDGFLGGGRGRSAGRRIDGWIDGLFARSALVWSGEGQGRNDSLSLSFSLFFTLDNNIAPENGRGNTSGTSGLSGSEKGEKSLGSWPTKRNVRSIH